MLLCKKKLNDNLFHSGYNCLRYLPKSLASNFFLVTTPFPAVNTSFKSIYVYPGRLNARSLKAATKAPKIIRNTDI